MLTRKDILAVRYRHLHSDTAVEYGIDVRMREQAHVDQESLAGGGFPESAVYERLAQRAWHRLYGELIRPINELVHHARCAARGQDAVVIEQASQRVLDLLKYDRTE